MSLSGYRLSPEAAAAERRASISGAPNVVAMPERRAVGQATEKRMIKPEDVFGESFVTIMGGSTSAADIVVTTDRALGVPAVSAAANFIANELASLPCPIYRRKADGREKVSGGLLATMLADAPNDYLTSFEWRKGLILSKLTGGRGLSFIERSLSGSVLGIWPMDPSKTTIRREGWKLVYDYRDGVRAKTYQADEVIDLPFMLLPDGLTHRGPISLGKDAIGLAIAVTEYGSRFFAGGGVPPFTVTGNFATGKGLQNAADDLTAAVRKAAKEKRLALTLPSGHEIKSLGVNPEDAQMIELQRFCVEQIARLYSIPPTFLQDLTNGTYSNTEQQDLHFVKHTLLHHAKQFEQELNLKLFGRRSRSLYVELNMDGLLRGDFKTRMEGWSTAVNAGVVTPAEARQAENWKFKEGSDRLFMQGATVPIDQVGNEPGNATGTGTQQ